MRTRQILSVFLTALFLFPPTIVKANGPAASACAVTKQLTSSELSSVLMFNAYLSQLQYDFGKPTFERNLRATIEKYYSTKKLIQVSPFYYEKVANLIEQARLRHVIAKTAGLQSEAWLRFERIMKDITLVGSQGIDLMNPLDKAAITLMKAVSDSAALPQDQAEGVARVSQMNAYLLRWRVFNGEIIDETALAESRKVAIVGVGLVGAGVLCSTLVISAPVVAGAGSAVAGAATNPVVAGLLVKLAETAAGAAIGFVGAPAAIVAQGSYRTMSEAIKQSANNQTTLSCELDKQTEAWKKDAGDSLLSAALTGATMGIGGGLMTVTAKSAQAVLYATGFGVGVAQLYSLGKLTQTAIESMAYYKMAEDAEEAGRHEAALQYLFKARDLAQEAGEHGLEAVIIGTLSYHVGRHFRHALHEGASAIRQLYAASSDTLPTAGKAAISVMQAVTAQAAAEASHSP